MKPQIALSIEQMKELQSLGLDCSDASMARCSFYSEEMLVTADFAEMIQRKLDLPNSPVHSFAYTLEDILLKLPDKMPDEYGPYDFSRRINEIEVCYATPDLLYMSGLAYETIMKSTFEMLKYIALNCPDRIKELRH